MLSVTVAWPAVAAPAAVSRPVCTNPASGAHWRIRIDPMHGTVDGNPAAIGPHRIRWRDDRDNRRYALDRASGVLTVIVPSSTGGWILWDRCAIAP